ncbi:hypothetical protein BASA61_010554 [Batrachochytrium salamandrivorans]|nr:hypothetical protein BASA61_010554 [Batrachochytrium salamandrivorans]
MYLQYTNFVIKANHNKDRKDVSLPNVGKREAKTILQVWLVDGLEFPQLARSCSAGVRYGCAQVPRQRGVFPSWGFVHSKLRSSLGSEKSEEDLVYIKTNASQFGNQNAKDWVDTETESESEVERD